MQAGMKLTQIGREIFFTDGRIYVRGKLTAGNKGKFADHILFLSLLFQLPLLGQRTTGIL